MNATVSTRKRAWQLADKLFPTDYMKDERDSLRAGYPVFNTTSTDDKYTGFHISDLMEWDYINMTERHYWHFRCMWRWAQQSR